MTSVISNEEYQRFIAEVAYYPLDPSIKTYIPERGMCSVPLYPIFGLAGEAGETLEEFKKAIRDDQGIVTKERRAKIALELGDTQWYLGMIAHHLGYTLTEIMQLNIEKLTERHGG